MTITAFINVLTALVFFASSSITRQAATAGQPAVAAPVSKQIVLTVDPARSTVHWSLDSSLHTVHGTFHVRRGTVSVDSATGKASGEIVVDATSGESGNDSRDRKMHNEILESSRYPEVIFRPNHIEGAISSPGHSTVTLHGIFSLHGADHEFSAPAQAELNQDKWKCTSSFSVPYIEWKLKNPNNLLLKAKPTVEIELELAGSIQRSDR
jgi:polyisoprenoid-binding protein YceI